MTRRSAVMLIAAQQSPIDPKVILDQSVTLDQTNMEKLRGYVWNSEETSYSNGRMIGQQGYEINLVSGSMYWRKTETDGKPLMGRDLEAERQRLTRHLASPGPGYNWKEERQYLELLPQVHTVTYLGKVTIQGRVNHWLETKPRPDTRSLLLSSLRYKLWIDEADLHWTRAEVHVIRDTQWLLHQLAIGRLSYPYSNNIVNRGQLKAGAVTRIELQHLPVGIWTLSRYETTSASGYRNELRYYNYRRFSSESQLLTGSP